jgi:hypothetical protein
MFGLSVLLTFTSTPASARTCTTSCYANTCTTTCF